MSTLVNLLSLGKYAQSLLYDMVYDVGKAGVKKIFHLDSSENLKAMLAGEFSQLKRDREKTEMILGQMLFQQELIAACLMALTKEFGMSTSVRLDNERITLEVPPEDSSFQECLGAKTVISPLRLVEHSEVVAAMGLDDDALLDMETEILSLKSDIETLAEEIKKAIITPQNPVRPNQLFLEALQRKTHREPLVYEISKSGFYAFSREKTRIALAAYPQFYISDKRGENICKAFCSESLSDANTIVLKVNLNSGYIFAVSEHVVL